MKKTIKSIAALSAMVLWMSFVIGLTGCGGGSTPPPAGDDDNKTLITNAEKVKAFEENKTIVQILTGVDLKLGATRHSDGKSADMFGGDEQAYFDGKRMTKGDMPCRYFYQPGFRGTIAEDSSIPGNWDYYRIDYSAEEGSEGLEPFTYLNYCSSGLYDITIWNINIQPDDYVRYNAMAQFYLSNERGEEFVSLQTVYTHQWDGTENDRNTYGYTGYIYITGSDGDYPGVLEMKHRVKKTFLDSYTVDKENHLGLPVGTVIDNCIKGEFSTPFSNKKDRYDKWTQTTTVVCEKFGIISIESKEISYLDF